MAARTLVLPRAHACVGCGSELTAGTLALWDAAARTVACLTCDSMGAEVGHIDPGVPGASAAREYERRKRDRERRMRDRHPRIGRLLLAVRDEPQHLVAFRVGSAGEAAVGESLERRVGDGRVVLLHDRRMPGGRGNIDHLAIAPTGVFVIDAKAWRGKVRVARPLFADAKLLIGDRDRSYLVDGLDRQVDAVRAALGDRPEVALQGVLCFTRADLPPLRTVTFRGHLLIYRRALAKRLGAQGPLSHAEVEATARALVAAFPPA